jgi:hypothetical protein
LWACIFIALAPHAVLHVCGKDVRQEKSVFFAMTYGKAARRRLLIAVSSVCAARGHVPQNFLPSRIARALAPGARGRRHRPEEKVGGFIGYF